MVGLLSAITEGYIKTGVADLTDRWDSRINDHAERRRVAIRSLSITSANFVRPFLRQIAKDLKRPFVLVERGSWRGAEGMLTVPATKKAFPLISGLMLVAEENEGGPSLCFPRIMTRAIYRRQDTTNHYFAFVGSEGEELLATWLVQCRTVPEFKKILGTI